MTKQKVIINARDADFSSLGKSEYEAFETGVQHFSYRNFSDAAIANRQ